MYRAGTDQIRCVEILCYLDIHITNVYQHIALEAEEDTSMVIPYLVIVRGTATKSYLDWCKLVQSQ